VSITLKFTYQECEQSSFVGVSEVEILLFYLKVLGVLLIHGGGSLALLLLLGGVLGNADLPLKCLGVELIGLVELMVEFLFKLVGGLLLLHGLFPSNFVNLGYMLSEFLHFVFSVISAL
jgi:hypothetical protein